MQSSSKSKSDTKLSRSQSIVLSIVSFTKMQFLLIFWLWITTTFTTSALERCRRQATSHALLLLYRVKVIFSSCAPATSVNCEVRTLVSPTSPSISGQGYAKVIPHNDGRTKQNKFSSLSACYHHHAHHHHRSSLCALEVESTKPTALSRESCSATLLPSFISSAF